MSHIVASVEQICYKRCLAVTPHDLYSTCRRCGSYNQEKKSLAEIEDEKRGIRNQQEKKQLADSWDYGM